MYQHQGSKAREIAATASRSVLQQHAAIRTWRSEIEVHGYRSGRKRREQISSGRKSNTQGIKQRG